MPLALVPHGIKVEAVGNQNGIPVVNTWHVDNGAAVLPSDLAAVANAFQTWFQAFPLPFMHSSYTLNQIIATSLESVGGIQHINTLTTANAGGNSTAPAAANAALVISWRTANTGRSYRGRSYMGALVNSDLADAQNVTAGIAAAYAGQGAALISAITALGKKLVVLSRFVALVARVVPIMTEIIALIVDTKIDSQRRRTAN